MNKDEEHLNLLATFHLILGAIGALFACFPLLHVGMGVMMLVSPESMGAKGNEAPPAFFGYLMIAMGLGFTVVGWACAICTMLSGRYLKRRQKRMFSFVIAAILCVFAPFGTVLGVFTLLVLSRESVVRLYAEREAPPAPLPA